MFQHTAARRRLALQIGFYAALFKGFNTQPPEGGWNRPGIWRAETTLFQHTAARRRLDEYGQKSNQKCYVSTHSRPKAAGKKIASFHRQGSGFNTQPPEGGWSMGICPVVSAGKFQHTAARRRLELQSVSPAHPLCFNTQPPEGGWDKAGIFLPTDIVSTHSRPKAAGLPLPHQRSDVVVSTHSRPKAAG